MRIISGYHKGFRFPKRAMPHARPTTDRAKEALFNILDQRIDYESVEVLDLYSGMGSIALEFISRGASHVTAIDHNRKSISYIQEIAQQLAVENLTVHSSKVLSFLKKTDKSYPVIFADPPYHSTQEIRQLLDVLSVGNFLTLGGIFILEHQSMTPIHHPALIESRNYGQSTFSFFNFVKLPCEK
jgi:16S rRNA (guanine966-N2)-methyltransferase